MKLIGITGGIGSGKTLACKIFQLLLVPVYNSDIRAKELMQSDSNLKKEIIQLLGENAYIGTNLNRSYVANIIFNNQEILNKVNSIVHAFVRIDFREWAKKHQETSYVLQEAAILFETGAYKNLDKTILIKSPDQLRIKRIMARDNNTEEKILERMKNQSSTDSIKHLADYIITNDDKNLILPQIIEIDKQLRN